MSRLSSVDVVLEITDTDTETNSGGFQDISAEVLAWNGFPREVVTEEGHGYGSAWVFNESTRVNKMGDITLQVFTDLTSGSAYDLLNAALGLKRTFRAQVGGVGGKYKKADVIVAAGNNTAERGSLLKTEFTLRLASSVTEGTNP